MSSELPEGWQDAQLGDVLALEYGRSLPEKARHSGSVPVFGSNGVVGWHDEPLVPSGGIIVGRKGTAGSVTVSSEPFWPIDTTYFVMPRRELDWGWLAATLHHARLHDLNEATGVPGLNRDKAYLKPILIPPLDEQRRIAEVLRSVDNAITAAEQAAQHARNLQSSLTTSLCFSGDFETVALGDILADIKYGTSAKCDAGQAEGHPVLRIPNVVNGRVELDDLKYAVASELDLRRFGLEPGDVVVVRTNGNPAYIGRSALIAKGMGTFLFASYLIRMRFDPRMASSAYVYATLNSQPVREKLLEAATTSAGNYNINTASLRQIAIPLPDLETQRQISGAIRTVAEAADTYENDVQYKRQMKSALMSDLLSGRVQVPIAVATVATRSVPPAFKRAVFAAEIVHQLHNDSRFGSVKHEKIVHLCELHLGLHQDLDRHAYKEAAGPYDPKARRSVERIFQQQKWFDTTKPDGNRVVYVPLEKAGGHAEYYDRYFGEQKPAIQSIIDLMRPLDTPQCEIVATLYAVWNDFLIDGQQPTDDEIVTSVLQWHPKKQEIGEDRWSRALLWMRQKGLVPKGVGEKTRVAKA